MLLYADEDFAFPAVEELRVRGHDVLTAQEDGRTAMPDAVILARAFALGACPRIHVSSGIVPRFLQGLGLSAWTPRSARTIPINLRRHCWTDAKS